MDVGHRVEKETAEEGVRLVIPPARRAPTRANGRTCGKCSACCRLLAAPDIGKEADAPCPHARSGRGRSGCGIYDERPPLCAAYECVWLQGAFRPQDKPSRLGLVFDTLARQDTEAGTVLCARKVSPGPLPKPANAMLRDLSQRMVVVLIESSNTARKVMGPPEKVEAFMRHMLPEASRGAAAQEAGPEGEDQ